MSLDEVVDKEPAVVYSVRIGECFLFADDIGLRHTELLRVIVVHLDIEFGMRHCHTNVMSRISGGVVSSDNESELICGVLRDRAVQVRGVLPEAPLPLLIHCQAWLQPTHGIAHHFGEHFVVGLHAFEHTRVVVVRHFLLTRACHCVVVLKHTHDIHHFVFNGKDVGYSSR